MGTSLGNIFVRVGANTKEFEKEMRQVQRISSRVFAGLSASIAAVGVVGAQFEKEMTKVGALTGSFADETGKTQERLITTAQEVAKTTEFTARQAAEGMSFFAMAGFDAEQTMAAIAPAARLATTGFLELGDAADIVTSIMAGMGIGFDELDDSINVIVKAATSAKTTVQQIGDAFSYAAPFAKTAGIEFEEVAAAIGILGGAGLQGARGGAALAMMTARLLGPTGRAKDALRDLGIVTKKVGEDGKEQLVGLNSILSQLDKAGATSEQLTSIFSQRSAGAAMILIDSLSKGEKSLKGFTERLRNSAGTSEAIFAELQKTTSFQFNVMKSNIEGAALVMFDEFKPAIDLVIGLVKGAAQAFSSMDPEIRKTIATVALATTGLAAFAAVASTAGLAVAVAFTPATLTIAAVVVALAAIGAAALIVYGEWENIAYEIAAVGDWLAESLSNAWDWVADKYMSVQDTILTALTMPFVQAGSLIAKAMMVIIGVMDMGLGWLEKNLGLPFIKMKETAAEALGAVKTLFMNAINAIAGKLSGFAKLLKLDIAESIDFVISKSGFPGGKTKKPEAPGGDFGGDSGGDSGDNDVMNSLNAGMKKLMDKLGASFSDLTGKGDALAKAFDKLPPSVNKATDDVEKFGDTTKKANANLDKFYRGLSTGVDVNKKTTLQDASTDLASQLGQISTEEFEQRNNMIANLAKTEEAMASAAKKAADEKKQAHLDSLNELGTALKMAGLEDVAAKIPSAMGGVVDIFMETLSKAAPELASTIKAGFEGFKTGGVIGAFVAVIAKIVSQLEPVIAAFEMVGEWFTDFLGALAPAFEVVRALFEVLTTVVDPIIGFIETLSTVLGKVMAIFTGPAEEAFGMLANLFESIFSVLGPLVEVIGGVVGGFSEMFKTLNFFQPLMALLNEGLRVFGEMMGEIGKALQDVADWIMIAIEDVMNEIGKAMFEMGKATGIDFLKDAGREMMAPHARRSLTTLAEDFFRDLVQRYGMTEADARALTERTIGPALTRFGLATNEIIDNLLETSPGLNVFTAATEAAQNAMFSFAEHVMGKYGPAIDTFVNALASADQPISTIMEQAMDFAENVLGVDVDQKYIQEMLKDKLDTMAEEIKIDRLTDEAISAATGVEELADAANEATAALTNLPSGIKIERARFMSSMGVSPTQAMAGGDAGGIGNSISIDQVTVVAQDDPEETWRQLQAAAARENQAQTGTTTTPEGGG